MSKTAILYRMVTDEHICPYGVKSKWLLERPFEATVCSESLLEHAFEATVRSKSLLKLAQ